MEEIFNNRECKYDLKGLISNIVFIKYGQIISKGFPKTVECSSIVKIFKLIDSVEMTFTNVRRNQYLIRPFLKVSMSPLFPSRQYFYSFHYELPQELNMVLINI